MSLLALGLTGCGADGTPDQPSGSAAAATATETTAQPAQITGGEVKLVSSVRPTIDALITALQGDDVSKARAAFADYDAAWNGVERVAEAP